MNTLERIIDLMRESGVKQSHVEGLIKSYRGKITEWKKGKSTPTAEEIRVIAEYFDVSEDYLLCKTSKKEISTEYSNDFLVMARKVGDMSNKDKKELFKMLNNTIDNFLVNKKQ